MLWILHPIFCGKQQKNLVIKPSTSFQKNLQKYKIGWTEPTQELVRERNLKAKGLKMNDDQENYQQLSQQIQRKCR